MSRMILHPQTDIDACIIYAVHSTTNAYMYKSTDGGASFVQLGQIYGTIPNPVSLCIARDNHNKMLLTCNSATDNNSAAFWSNDGGVSWNRYTNTSSFMHPACISNDGMIMIVPRSYSSNNYVYMSKDGGSTWISKSTMLNLRGIMIADDNMKVFAARYTAKELLLSTDCLNSYRTITTHPFTAVDAFMTGDGRRLWIGRNAGPAPQLAYSDDDFATYTPVSLPPTAYGTYYISGSVDGKHMYVMADTVKQAYVSHDYGVTWVRVLSAYNDFRGMKPAVSRSGKYIVYGTSATNGKFYYSNDFGTTWQVKYTGVALSPCTFALIEP